MNKGRNVPHIKTYYQVNDGQQQEQGKTMHWFVLGSHNLSKGTWGNSLVVRHSHKLFAATQPRLMILVCNVLFRVFVSLFHL